MSEIAPENPTSEAASAAPKKKKSNLLFIILGVVLLAGGGGGGFYYWRTASASAAEAQEGGDEKKAKPKKAAKHSGDEEDEPEEKADSKSSKSAKKSLQAALPDDEGVTSVVELQPFIVNLADENQERYLRMTVSVGVGGEDGAHGKPDQVFITRVRNAILAVLSLKKSDEILNVEGKTKLRKEVLQAAQAASEHPHVEAIYITDFIVQL